MVVASSKPVARIRGDKLARPTRPATSPVISTATTPTKVALTRDVHVRLKSRGTERVLRISWVHGTARLKTSVCTIDLSVHFFKCFTCSRLTRRTFCPCCVSRNPSSMSSIHAFVYLTASNPPTTWKACLRIAPHPVQKVEGLELED